MRNVKGEKKVRVKWTGDEAEGKGKNKKNTQETKTENDVKWDKSEILLSYWI